MGLRSALEAQPHLFMGDVTGRPLDYGKVFFGEENKDPEFYPIDIFYDENLTIPAVQPVRTKGGFLNANGDMCEIFARELTYSVKVLDQYGRKVFYKPDMSRTNTDANVSSVLPFLGAIVRTQADKNADYVSVKDFGAVGDGSTDDTAAFQTAFNTNLPIFVPAGDYKLSNSIYFEKNKNAYLYGDGKGKTILAFTQGGLEKEFGTINGETCVIKDLSIQTKSINASAAILLYRADSKAAFEDDITVENISISCYGGPHTSNATFKYGIRIEHIRFYKMTGCYIWGQEGYSPSAENSNAVAGLSILCSDTVAQFGFSLTNNWITAWTHNVRAEGWFEGIYITGGEYWNAYYAFYFSRPAVSTNSPMAGTVKLTNLHCNASKAPIFANNVSGIGITNCDIQNGVGGGVAGANLLMLINCPKSNVTGCSLANYYPKSCNGIYIQSSQTVVVSGNTITDTTDSAILVAASQDITIQANNVSSPNFKANYGVYATDDSTGLISKNNLIANYTCNKGGMTYDPPRIQYTGVAQLNVGVNNITITPPRPLSFKPDNVVVNTEYSSAGAVQAYYNYTNSNGAGIVITLNAAAAGTYRYSVEYPLN